MRLLAAVERFLERAFERSSVRLFRAPLQPIQLERRLLHALELGQVAGPEGPLAPDRYRVAVHPTDLAGLGPTPADIAAALADAALGFARRRGYRVRERPRVELVASDRVLPGDVRVEVAFSRGPGERGAARGLVEVPQDGSPPVEATGVLPPRPVPAPGVRLVVTMADGRRQVLPLDGRPLTIGRAPDNVVRIDDRRVSRHHARIVAREGVFVLVDLGSANGTWVHGLRVSELVLGVGDRIEIGAGAAELRIEATSGSPLGASAPRVPEAGGWQGPGAMRGPRPDTVPGPGAGPRPDTVPGPGAGPGGVPRPSGTTERGDR